MASGTLLWFQEARHKDRGSEQWDTQDTSICGRAGHIRVALRRGGNERGAEGCIGVGCIDKGSGFWYFQGKVAARMSQGEQ